MINGRTLPPIVTPVDRVLYRMCITRGASSITVTTVGNLRHKIHMLDQFTEILGLIHSTGGIGGDASTGG